MKFILLKHLSIFVYTKCNYYVVTLSEKIRHFFLPDWFDDMNAPVKAVVLLRPHNEGLITPIEELERNMVIDNWEYTNKYKGTEGFYSGKWNHYMSGNTNNDTGISYSTGNSYRTESVRVKTTSGGDSDGQSTAANGGKFYSKNEVDSINIDFQAEIRVNNSPKFTTDWDLDYSPTKSLSIFKEYTHVDKNNSWGIDNGDDKRILFNVEFNEAFPTRDITKEADILWTRIESDPLKNPYSGAGVTVFNSVRQITLNFNTKNTDKDFATGNYKHRPYFIFYDGPENIDYKKDENGVLIRHSQPVVINLNADLNAILYMPESPVTINGNNHAWHGFIIARCFLKSLTEEEMTNNGTVQLYDGFNPPSTDKGYNKSYKFTGDYTAGIDGKGQTIYFHDDDLLTKEEIDAAHKNGTITTDETTGNIIVKELIQAPKYPVISFTKDLYPDGTTIAEYFEKTAEYINENYTKEKYAKFSGIEESAVSMITFPKEKETLRNASGVINHNYGNFTAVEIPVTTADLRDSDPDPDVATKDNKYVKVMLGDEEKYIAKSKLPHFRVKYNANYPYVCIYDLKTGLGWGLESPFVCVKPMDNTTSTADSAIVFTNSKNKNVEGSNQWGDVWVIERRILEDIYNKEYIPSKIEFGDENGVKFFMRKSEMPKAPEIVAKYHKVTLANGDVRYIKDGDEDEIRYYTKVQNNANNLDNYIIVDKNGNMLTKALTAPEIFEVKDALKVSDDDTTVETEEDDDEQTDEQKNNAVTAEISSSDYSSDYLTTYTREPKVPPKGSGDLREQPKDKGYPILNGNYRGKDNARLNKDYRIPVFERVYEAHDAFGLNKAESYYSFFQIDELWRVNYLYLNVNENATPQTVNREESPLYWQVEDMFFTKVRAKWID